MSRWTVGDLYYTFIYFSISFFQEIGVGVGVVSWGTLWIGEESYLLVVGFGFFNPSIGSVWSVEVLILRILHVFDTIMFN